MVPAQATHSGHHATHTSPRPPAHQPSHPREDNNMVTDPKSWTAAQAAAAQWLIARAVNGTGLRVQAGEAEALITKPGRRGGTRVRVRVRYAGGGVYRNGTYLGILDGYEPSSGQRVGQSEILAALDAGTP
ncbi:MAG: hypothetical protein ACRDNF_14885 [Streptosporangiaceae bacterium]